MRRFIALSVLLIVSSRSGAQELEPRAYSPSPTGTHFVVLGVGESSGGVSVDPALPIENVSGTIDSVVAGYGQTFGLFGRSASLGLVVPYVDAAGERRRRRGHAECHANRIWRPQVALHTWIAR